MYMLVINNAGVATIKPMFNPNFFSVASFSLKPII